VEVIVPEQQEPAKTTCQKALATTLTLTSSRQLRKISITPFSNTS
jgi:hypothetical protein